jgi:hypothetical protein
VGADDTTDPPAEAVPRVDVVVPRAPTEDRAGVRVLRLRNTPPADPAGAAPTGQWVVEAGEVRPMIEGRPLNGAEVVALRPRGDGPAFDVDVVMPRGQLQLAGPPQVATEQYRRNWDETFGEELD